MDSLVKQAHLWEKTYVQLILVKNTIVKAYLLTTINCNVIVRKVVVFEDQT